MAGAKITGYILALAGLAVIALSNPVSKILSFLGAKALLYTIIAGVALVAVGVVLAISGDGSSNPKQASEEVPIYEGEGRHRKIVGYRKAK